MKVYSLIKGLKIFELVHIYAYIHRNIYTDIHRDP